MSADSNELGDESRADGAHGSSGDFSHLFHFGANKAGMESTDASRRAEIIYNSSKDSDYFKRAARLADKQHAKSQEAAKQIVAMTPAELAVCRKRYEACALEYDSRRNLTRICCVIDMDMFFAAVEIRDAPHLADKPVSGGIPPHCI
jgi:DNA polymerase kappa